MTISYQVGSIPEWTVGDRLRKAREHTGMDQAQFAEHAGLSRTGVSNAEVGKSVPRRSTLRVWALASGVPLQWIETGKAPSPDGDGASGLPRLDLNQQPFEKQSQQVTTLSRRLHLHHAA